MHSAHLMAHLMADWSAQTTEILMDSMRETQRELSLVQMRVDPTALQTGG